MVKEVCTSRQIEALYWWGLRDATFQRIGDVMLIDRVTAFQHVRKGIERLEEEKSARRAARRNEALC